MGAILRLLLRLGPSSAALARGTVLGLNNRSRFMRNLQSWTKVLGHYHIRDTSITWAQLFGAIERVKLNFNIEDYSVSQTTLEQVFLNFARGQRGEDN